MAFAALLGAASKCEIGSIAVDGVTNEVHNSSADVTEHPVESGAQIADHYRKRPDTLQIQAIVSRTPIATGFPGQSAINSVANLINGSDPVFFAWETLHTYMKDAERIDVITGKKFYQNMVIVDLTDPREVNDWMRFNITLRELQTAFTDSVEALIQTEIETAKGVVQDAVSKGTQATDQIESEAKKQSLLTLAANFIGG